MRDSGVPVAVLWMIAWAAAPCLALDDGVTLNLDRAPGAVVLEWSGGTSPYRLYRSTDPTAVTVTSNLLGETGTLSFSDPVPREAVVYYRVASVPDVFRVTDIDLRDPHVFTLALILCLDVTDSAFNPQLQDQIDLDGDLDGLLDLSALILFRPLDPGSTDGNAAFGIGDCTVPPDTVCDQDPLSPPVVTTASNVTMGSCMAPYPGTTTLGYAPAIVPTDAPPTCFVSGGVSVVLDVGPVGIPLQDVQLSANYVGDPATSLVDGLMRGFIAEAVADTLLVDLGAGEVPLSSLLPGGQGNCASHDDRDTGLDGSTVGWWLYFNFTASRVPYAGP